MSIGKKRTTRGSRRSSWFKKISLSLVLAAIFLISILGQVFTGLHSYNEEQDLKHGPTVTSVSQYLRTGHFLSSVFENMESEFLQMSLFVGLTAFLYQKGSAESRPLPEERSPENIEDDLTEDEYCRRQIKKHPILWRLYERSLTIALFFLFAVFFTLHAYGAYLTERQEKIVAGLPAPHFVEIFSSATFWFESFQNWQSEFFSILVMGLLTIFLRHRDSAQSKKMSAPNWKTGSS